MVYPDCMGKPVYKILTEEQWAEFEGAHQFAGAPVDLNDGFIHLSTATQLAETASKHFAGQDHLVLVAVDPDRLGDELVYEVSRGGALFPHLYAPLSIDAVLWAKPFLLDRDGNRLFPDEFEFLP